MSKFNVGDWVEFSNGQLDGEVMAIEEDGFYCVEFSTGTGGGSVSIHEDEITLTNKPDFRLIDSMCEKEFDEAINAVFKKMRKQYPSLTSGDMQTLAMFVKIFKEEYLIEQRF